MADSELNRSMDELTRGITSLSSAMGRANDRAEREQDTQSVSGDLNTEAFEKATKRAFNRIKIAGNKTEKSLARALASHEGSSRKIAALSAEQYAAKLQEIAGIEYGELRRAASIAEFGYVIDDVNGTLEEQIEAHRTLTENIQENSDALAENKKQIGLFKKNLTSAAFALAALKAVGKEAYEVAQAAAATGSRVTAQQVLDAKKLGMSTSQLIRISSEYRQTMNATDMTTNEFNDALVKGAYSMVQYTGSLEAGMRLQAENMQLAKLSGASSSADVTNFTTSMNEAMKDFQAATGRSADEFTKLNKSLRMSSDTQNLMFKMNKDNRLLLQQEMAHRRNALTSGGLMIEQADSFINTLNALQGDTAKDRLRKAAVMQATLGAMGLGAEGAEAAAILRKGGRAEPDDIKRFKAIGELAATVSSERAQGEFGTEMVQDHLNDLMGGLFGPKGPFAAIETQGENAGKNNPANRREGNENEFERFIKEIVVLGDVIKGVNSDNIAGPIVTGIAGAASLAAASIVAPAAAVTAGVAAAGIAVAAGVGLVLGTGINYIIDKKLPEFGNWVGESTYNAVTFVEAIGDGIMSGKFWDNVASFWTGAFKAGADSISEYADAVFAKYDEFKDGVSGTWDGITDAFDKGVLVEETVGFWGDFFGIGGSEAKKVVDIVEPVQKSAEALSKSVNALQKNKEENLANSLEANNQANKVLNDGLMVLQNTVSESVGELKRQNEILERQTELSEKHAEENIDALNSNGNPIKSNR